MTAKVVIHLLVVVLLVMSGCGAGGLELGNFAVSNEQLRGRARAVLAAAVDSERPALRSHALESLAELGGLEAPGLIRRGLHDPVGAVRFAAAAAAGDMKDYTSRHLLERLLWDKDDSVKLAAAYALEKMGDERFGDWYDGTLAGEDVQLASQACMLLGKLGRTPLRADSQGKLWQVLRRPGQAPAVKLQAAEALAQLGDKEILNKLMAYAGSGYADDRMMAISGLEVIDTVDSRAMLTVLADDPQIEVRLAAVRALGAAAGEAEVALARQGMRYVDTQGDDTAAIRVRGLAALALGKVGQDKDAALLYKAMADESSYLQVAAARAVIDFLRRRGEL